MIECISYPFRLTLDRWVMELIELVCHKGDWDPIDQDCYPYCLTLDC